MRDSLFAVAAAIAVAVVSTASTGQSIPTGGFGRTSSWNLNDPLIRQVVEIRNSASCLPAPREIEKKAWAPNAKSCAGAGRLWFVEKEIVEAGGEDLNPSPVCFERIADGYSISIDGTAIYLWDPKQPKRLFNKLDAKEMRFCK